MVANKSQAEIMIVDDARETLQMLTKVLHGNGFDVRPVSDGQGAINSIQNKAPDLLLLDISMSGRNGYEVCRWVKSNRETEDIPIIFISALDDIRNKVKAFELGAVDYIVKPLNLSEVLARIETHLRISYKIRGVTKLTKPATHRHDTFTKNESNDSNDDREATPYQSNADDDSISLIHRSSSPSPMSDGREDELERISHELRNPIHTVSLTFTLLKKRIDPTDPKLKEYFERIERNLKEISHIIAETTGK